MGYSHLWPPLQHHSSKTLVPKATRPPQVSTPLLGLWPSQFPPFYSSWSHSQGLLLWTWLLGSIPVRCLSLWASGLCLSLWAPGPRIHPFGLLAPSLPLLGWSHPSRATGPWLWSSPLPGFGHDPQELWAPDPGSCPTQAMLGSLAPDFALIGLWAHFPGQCLETDP